MSDQKPDFSPDEVVFTTGVQTVQTARGQLTLKSKFLPWHKPRKNWIRKNQWNKCIRDLVSQLDLNKSKRPLDYLCLPGQDLLDIRALAPICKELDVMLRFLGLNYVDPKDPLAQQLEMEQATSLSEVHGMDNIDRASEVLPEKFESIATGTSVTYDKIINSRDTFDIVNIDLCRAFGEQRPSGDDATLYNALFTLFHKQATHRNDDWLFFLTTRNNTNMVDSEVWNKLISIINKKLNADSTFLDSLTENGIITKECIFDGKILKEKLTRDSLVGVFGIGVGLWIVECLTLAIPGWNAKMLTPYGYHVHMTKDDSNCDMLSLAFLCSKIPHQAKDANGLAGCSIGKASESPETHRANCEAAILQEHLKQIDLDVLLHKDPIQYAAAVEESVILLRSARYDEAEYRKFEKKSFEKIDKYLREANLLPHDEAVESQ